MNRPVFGRTNLEFPKIWLRLELSDHRTEGEDIHAFVDKACLLKTPLDISSAPALFGSILPNSPNIVLIQQSSTDFERATDSKHAADLVQAHLIQTLSCIRRPTIDFYFLRLRKTLEENQLSGVMEALESARQENHVRFFGLYAENLGATLGNWQFHDAFDVISVPATFENKDRDTVRRMALQRRTGFLVRTNDLEASQGVDDTLILSVRSCAEITRLEKSVEP